MHRLAIKVGDSRASELRRQFHETFAGTAELPVPVESIAEDLLGLLVGQSEPIEISGMLLPAERRIVLNAGEVETRRRFTLAHEIGHWICHVLAGRKEPVYCRADEIGVGEGRALEREANVFAAELLMPEPLVRERFDGIVAGAATAFDVSELAMGWRLYNLKLVKEAPASHQSAESRKKSDPHR